MPISQKVVNHAGRASMEIGVCVDTEGLLIMNAGV
jgi:hypothetical protein